MTSQRPARELLPRAADRFGAVVHAIRPDGWGRPTPCSEWIVRDVLHHMVWEHRWVPHLLGGGTLEQMGGRLDGDLLGDDPVGAWDAAIAESLRASAAVSESRLVHLSSGQRPAGDYANEMLTDLTVHAWDLARGAGLDERLDPVTVDAALALVQPWVESWLEAGVESSAGSAYFGPPVPIEAADPQSKLLALLGRDPG